MPCYPILVVGQEGDSRALGALDADERLELFRAPVLTPERVALAHRVTAVLVVTEHDPMGVLLHVITAGVDRPTFVALPRVSDVERADLMAAGAAGCLLTPADAAEVARLLEALALCEAAGRMDPTMRILLDPIDRTVRYREKTVILSPREFAVLHFLCGRGGEPVAASDLYTRVWGREPTARSATEVLAIYIFQLRRKLGRIGLDRAVRTVRGFGYALDTDRI